MSDDNAAIAAAALESLRDKKVSDLLGYDGMLANATIAQVHATPAVAGQLRVANLIAYKQLHTARQMHRDPRTDDWEVDSLPVSRDNITDEIDRLLALEHLDTNDA